MVMIYVASSWRNPKQLAVVSRLKEAGHTVYDFRNPAPGNTGFSWSSIDPEWQGWTPEEFRAALRHPIAREGMSLDECALRASGVTILVMPCGRSAHLELGVAIGLGQRTAILLADGEPELMYGMVDLLTPSFEEILKWL